MLNDLEAGIGYTIIGNITLGIAIYLVIAEHGWVALFFGTFWIIWGFICSCYGLYRIYYRDIG